MRCGIEAVIERIRLHGCGCWTLPNAANPDGYVRVGVNKKQTGCHRAVYEYFRGPIPDGLQLDHLCRNRACCNPDHLEPVTGQANVLRGHTMAAKHAAKTHCPAGHPYDGDNLYVSPAGRRHCRICRKVNKAAFDARRKSSLAGNPTWQALLKEYEVLLAKRPNDREGKR